MADKRSNKGVFDADPFGLGGTSSSDFFDPIKAPTSRSSSVPLPRQKALTPKQQEKALAEAEVKQYVDEATAGIQQLRTSPEWLNASLNKRKELYNNWTKNKYVPMVEGLANDDAKKALRILPSQLLYPDIADLARSIDQGPGQLKATGIGALRGAQRTGTQLIDSLVNAPADDAKFAVGLEEYRKKYGEYPKFGSPEYEALESRSYENRMNSPVRQAYANRDQLLATAREQVRATDIRGTDYYKSLVADGISEEAAYNEALESAARDRVGSEIQRILSLEISDSARRLQVTQDLENEATQRQGAGQLDRNIQREEDKANYGDFVGTLRNAVRGNGVIPGTNLLQTVGEQAGNIAPVVGAAFVNPYLAVPVGAELGKADAVATAQQNIQRLTEQQLQTIPLYNQLRSGGYSPDDAKAALALQAGSVAELPGQIIGAATAIPGAEGVLGAGLRSVVSGTNRTVAPTVAQTVVRGATGTAISGLEEGANQLVANVSAQNVGAPINTWDGVAEATAQGIVVGAPLAGGGAYLESRAESRARPVNPTEPTGTPPVEPSGNPTPTIEPTVDGGVSPTDPSPTGPRQGDSVSTIVDGQPVEGIVASINPDGSLNVATEGGLITTPVGNVEVTRASPVQSDGAPVSEIPEGVVQELRNTLADIRQRQTPLTIPEREFVIAQFAEAEQAGVPRSAIEAGLRSIVGNALDGESILDTYLARVQNNGNQPTSTTGADATAGSTINDGVTAPRLPDGRTEADTGGVPASDRGVETASLTEQTGGLTENITADVTADGTTDTDTVISRSPRDTTETVVVNEETTQGLGGVPTPERAISGRDNTIVSDQIAGDNVSDRGTEYSQRSGDANGQLYGRTPESEARVNSVIAEATIDYEGIVYDPVNNNINLSRTVNGVTESVPMESVTGGPRLDPALFNRDVTFTTPNGRVTGRITGIALGADPVVYIRNNANVTPVRYSEVTQLRIGDSVANVADVRGRLDTATTLPEGAEVSMRSQDGRVTNGTIASVSIAQDGRPVYGIRHVTPDGRVLQYGNIPEDQVTRIPRTMDEFASTPINDISTAPETGAPTPEATVRTPAGRDISSLQQAIDKFTNTRNDDVLLELGDLQSAITLGDFVAADSIADTLAASGRRDFMAPVEPTGQSNLYLSDAIRNLDDGERTAINEAYQSIRNDLPAEFNSQTAFNNAMIIDALQERSSTAPITPWYSRLSEGAKNVFRKLASLMAAIVVAVGINMGTPVNDAMASTGRTMQAPVAEYSVGRIMDGPSVRGTSAETKLLNSWIRESNDNLGKRYIIADKQSGMIHIMDAKGNVLNSSPALFGKRAGDGVAYGQTPAGTFNLTRRTDFKGFGGDIQQFGTDPSGNVFAIHRVTTDKPSQKRLQRLASENPQDARISLGCINVPVDVYNKYLSSGFDGRLYIMPDQGRLTDTFAQFRAHELSQQVYEGTEMPQDVGKSTNTNVETYTYNIANQVRPTIKYSDGLIGTVAAAEMSGDVYSGSYTNRGNDVSDLVGWGILGTLGAVAAYRMRRTRRNNRGGNEPAPPLPPERDLGTETLPPPVPTDPLTPNMYNANNVGSGGRDGSVWTGQIQQRNQGQNLIEQGARAGNWARMAFRDYQAPVVDFEYNAGLIPEGAEFDSGPLAQELKLSSSTRQNIASEYQQQYVTPMINTAARAAQRLSMDAPVAFDLMGTWRTMLHIPEANRVLRERLVQARDNALLGEDARLARETQNALTMFDRWQNGTSDVQVPTAGGLTDARADAIRRSIENIGFTMEELNNFRGNIDSAIRRIISDRLRAGTLLPEEVDAWSTNNFENYVPLTVPKETPTGDAFTGTSILNPAGDHAREGSMRLASSSGFAVVEFLNRTANDLAMVPVREALYDVHRRLSETGDTHGLHAVNLRNTSSPLFAEAMRTPGIIRTIKTVDEETGRVRYSKEKYFFTDREVSRALFEPPRPILAVQKAQGITRAVFGLITRYQPLFPVKTYLPDVLERIYNLGNRRVLDVEGNRVSPARLRVKMVANLMNPALYVQVAASMAGRNFGKFGRAAQEVRELGGTTTYRDILRNQVSDIRKDITRSVGARRILGNLDNALLHWIEFWGEAAVTNTYSAMRDLGVEPRDAAFRTKDLLNFHNRGRYTESLRAIKPFVNATIEGNYNMVRSLSSSRGRYEAFGLVLAGMGLYSLLRAMGPEDDDLGKKIDSLSIDELSRNIPLFTSDGNFAKIPVGFGMPQVAWTTSVALSRMADNVMTPLEATSAFALVTLKNVQPIDIPVDMAHDNPMAAFLQLITPSVLLPEAQLGMNRNAFGGRIHADSTFGKAAADSGMARTSPLWTSVAQSIKSATNGKVDMYPESVRYLAQGHLMGPLSGLYTYWDKDVQITRPNNISAKQEAGPLLTAVGATYFMGNDASIVSQRYYTYKDRAENILKKYNVPATDDSNRGQPGAAGATAQGKLLAAGATADEATLVRLIIDGDKLLTKQKRVLSDSIKPYRNQNMSVESLAPIFKATADEEERIMREVIRNARVLQR